MTGVLVRRKRLQLQLLKTCLPRKIAAYQAVIVAAQLLLGNLEYCTTVNRRQAVLIITQLPNLRRDPHGIVTFNL
jgi:hypothetical protein